MVCGQADTDGMVSVVPQDCMVSVVPQDWLDSAAASAEVGVLGLADAIPGGVACPGVQRIVPKIAFADDEERAADPGPPAEGNDGQVVAKDSAEKSTPGCARLLKPLHWLESSMRKLVGFFTMISLLSIGACALAFAALPVSNPLIHDNWWHCSLVCTVVWVPLSILYIGQLLDHMLYKPFDRSLPFKHFVVMWLVQSACMSGVMIALANCWANPAPLNGAIGATTGIVMNALIIYFGFVPALSDSAGVQCQPTIKRTVSHRQLMDIRATAMWVLVFFVAAVLQLMIMLTISAFLLWLNRWYWSVIALPLVRWLYTQLLGSLAKCMKFDARPLGQSMAAVTIGIALAIAVGSASSWTYTFMCFTVDLLNMIVGAVSIAQLERGGCYISELLLFRTKVVQQVVVKRKSISSIHDDVPADAVARARHRMTTYLLSAEMGELIVVLNYSLCWLIIRVGPNSGSFSGNGTSDFGLQVPPGMWDFVGNILLLFLAEVASFVVMKDVLSRCFDVDLHRELRKLVAEYGPILAAQSAWIVVTSFCMTMIHCGLDYSLKWSYL